MKTRLAPMPTDTALARLVARLVARWPIVLRTTHARRVAELQRQHAEDVAYFNHAMRVVRRDLRELAQSKLPLLQFNELDMADVSLKSFNDRMACTISVQFQTINYRIDELALRRGRRVSDETAYMLRTVVGELSRHHSEQFERELLRMAEKVFPVPEASPQRPQRGPHSRPHWLS